MSNEEAYISNRFGKKNHFTVPEGYFEQLTERVMSCLPETPADANTATVTPLRPTLMRRLRPWLAAACVAAVIAGTTVYINRSISTTHSQDELADANVSDTYIDDAADYVMVDNQDIYAYLLADM